MNFGTDGYMCGIYTSARVKVRNDNLCIIFLNAGLIHKIGPNRIYKKLSIDYSEIGFASFRMDFSGLGDSGFSHEKVNNTNGKISEVKLAMNWLQENKGIDRFLLAGICSGAKAAWDASLDDQRVVGLCLVDGVYADDRLLKDVGEKAERHLKVRYYKKHIFSLNRWVKLLSGKSKFLNFKKLIEVRHITTLVKKLAKRLQNKTGDKQVKYPVVIGGPGRMEPWEILFKRNVKIQMIFCEGGHAIDIYNWTLSKQLSRYKRSGILQSTFVKDVDHTFTPTWSQNYLSDLTSSWLRTEFEIAHQL